MRRHVMTVIPMGLLMLGLSAPPPVAAEPAVRRAGDVAWVTGGIGHDEQERMERLGSHFNLRLTLTGTRGQYLASVPVTITDGDGDVVLDTETDGPFLLAELPAGGYTVRARAGGAEETRTVTVRAGNRTDLAITLPVTGGPEPEHVPERAD